MGWGVLNIAKDILLTPKYLADTLCDFINNDPIGKINGFPAYVLNGGLEQSISGLFQQFGSDFEKANTEKKSEMVMGVVGNLALLFIPGTVFTKFGKVGDAAKLSGNIAKAEKADEIFNAGKVLAEEKAAIQAERAAELEQSFAQAERKMEQAAIALEKAKAAKEAEKAAKAAAKDVIDGSKVIEGGLKPIHTKGLKVIETRTPDVANKEWLAKGYDKPPYDPNFEVKIVQAGSEGYVRVFTYNADGTSNKLGGWLMKKSDIEGLTPSQIADKYALPKAPTHICDVSVRSDYKLQTGVANKVDEWGKGGGQQFDTMGKRLPQSSFINERRIGE